MGFGFNLWVLKKKLDPMRKNEEMIGKVGKQNIQKTKRQYKGGVAWRFGGGRFVVCVPSFLEIYPELFNCLCLRNSRQKDMVI